MTTKGILRDIAEGVLLEMGAGRPRTLVGFKIAGFASHRTIRDIRIRPLTLLCGANSSGKSSAIRPLLLLKQTLDSTFDPGPLLLSGANASLSNYDQIFTRLPNGTAERAFDLSLSIGDADLDLTFTRNSDNQLFVSHATYNYDLWGTGARQTLSLSSEMNSDDIEIQLPDYILSRAEEIASSFRSSTGPKMSDLAKNIVSRLISDMGFDTDQQRAFLSDVEKELHHDTWVVSRNRCFLTVALTKFNMELFPIDPSTHSRYNFAETIRSIIHVPAVRTTTVRSQPVADVDGPFTGTFDDYTASVVAKWEEDGDSRLGRLMTSLNDLALTKSITARRITDAVVEIRVARPGQSSKDGDLDMIRLGDVGVGVAYALPTLVALEAAIPGQVVYVEQPETHLHPRAQYGLAKALVRAANRGVRVVAETHSSLLLMHIQTLVARSVIDHTSVQLHWFSLDPEGYTSISSVEPDENGRTGDWPEDFADIEMDASSAFLRAARER